MNSTTPGLNKRSPRTLFTALKFPLAIQILLMILMITVALLGSYARPTQYLSELHPRTALKQEVPKRFENWELMPADDLMIVDPAQQDVLNYLYTDLFTATYVSDSNRRVMLSIAYGKDQSDGHDVHSPKLCYPAQGFSALEEWDIPVRLDAHRTIMVHYMKMQRGKRVEPLLYWTLSGDFLYRSKIQKRLVAFRYSRNNLIPDGMIVRVSTLENNTQLARDNLTNFMLTWYQSLPASMRLRYFGQPES